MSRRREKQQIGSCDTASEESRVLRRQLPLPRPYVEPRTQTERKLAAIWCAILNMDLVGIDDSYNDLGGDSFLATVIFAMIEETFRIKMPLAMLAKAPTVAELARAIDRRQT
jgi:acyl carrier protein